MICELGKAEFEERPDNLQKNLTSIVGQNTRNLWEDTEAMRRELDAQIAVVEVRTRHMDGSDSGPTSLHETTEIRLRNILDNIPPTV